MKHEFHQTGSSGFTLAEIMMAFALASLMIVSVFGVIGTSQVNVNSADLKSTQARISQKIVSEIVLNEWASVMKFHNTSRYFDPEGNQLKVTKEDDDEVMWAYRAKIEINETQAEVPGSPEADPDAEDAPPVMSRKVVVKITNGYFPGYDFEKGSRHKNFPTWIAKTDKM